MGTVEKNKVIELLTAVEDPEFEIDIYNLGLVYGVEVEGTKVTVLMTLTSLGCPTAPLIEMSVREAVGAVEGVEGVEVEWTFDPPWSPEMMTDEAREMFEAMGYL